MLFVRFGEKIAIRAQQVRDLHAIAVSVFARPKDVTVEVNRFFRKWQDGRNFNFVSVLDIELLKRFGRSALVVVFWEIDPKHGAVLVRLYAINIDMAQCP